MTPKESYGKRLHKVAREDFKTFWSAHRLWATFANAIAPVVIVVLLTALRLHGNMINLPWIVTIAVASFVISLLGNYIISMWRGAKILDLQLRQQIATVGEKPDKQKRTATEEYYYEEARTIVERMSDPAKKLLRYIWVNHKLSEGAPYQVPGLASGEIQSLLQFEFAAEPISRIVRRHVGHNPMRVIWWDIPPIYRDALEELLHQRPVTPLQ